jgi:hypothetical protein
MAHESLPGDLRERFSNINDFESMSLMLENWTCDTLKVKGVFMGLAGHFGAKEGSILTFKARSGVSFSLKAYVKQGGKDERLFGLVDIIDDDPENRWLSVCFYDELITDPEGQGNLIPEGLMGEDGYCFDLFEEEDSAILYVKGKIDEAYINSKKLDK